MSTKIPLLDPLGLPISPEVLWNSFKEVASVAAETIKEDVAGRGLDMSGSLTNFQKGKERTPNAAKSPELIQLERDMQEAGRKKDFYNVTEADLNKVIGEDAKEALTKKREEIATLNSLQPNFEGVTDKSGNTYKYHEANAEKKQAEDTGFKIQQEREQKLRATTNSPASKFKMGENELGLGGENKNHFTAAVG